MAERIYKQEREAKEVVDEHDAKKVGLAAAKGAEVKAGIDELLDEIDEVLEVNAEDFVKNYIQKGGE